MASRLYMIKVSGLEGWVENAGLGGGYVEECTKSGVGAAHDGPDSGVVLLPRVSTTR